jgi:hypothetical protein
MPPYGDKLFGWRLSGDEISKLVESVQVPCVLPSSELYTAIKHLLDAYTRDELHIGPGRLCTQKNMQYTEEVAGAAERLQRLLGDPRANQFYGTDDGNDSFTAWRRLTDLWEPRVACVVKDLRTQDGLRQSRREQNLASKQTSRNLEEFIRGPLAEGYKRLFNREAASTIRGPFIRFGVKFFELIGRPATAKTIASHLRPRRPKSKKRRLHRFPTG